MDSLDLSSFSPKLMFVLGFVVISILAFAMFPMIAGAGQGVYLEAKQDGSCELAAGKVRFDRVYLSTSSIDDNADDINWATAVSTVTANSFTAGTSDVSEGTSKGCKVDALASTFTGTQVYALTSTDIKFTFTPAALGGLIPAGTAGWEDPASMFEDNNGLLIVIIGVIALIIGVAPMGVLGYIGYVVLQRFQMGGMSGLTLMIVSTLGAIVIVTLMGTFVDFISISYDAIDPNRFTVFNLGLASLAPTLKQFWGIIFLGSFVGLGAMLFVAVRRAGSSGMSGGESESRILT